MASFAWGRREIPSTASSALLCAVCAVHGPSLNEEAVFDSCIDLVRLRAF
jgi:hypothetical protein